MNFSKYLSIVYTFIIAIPLMIFLFVASQYLRTIQYNEITLNAEKTVADNTAKVENSILQMERLESIVTSDYDLLRTFYFSEISDQEIIIDTLHTDIRNLERLQFAMPQISALRLFLQNENIPERWPILFSEQRFDFGKFKRWTYNYRDEVMGNIESSKQPSVCLTSEMLLNKRHVGYLQISMKMTDFFPFLYKPKEEYNADYVFFQNESIVPVEEKYFPVRDAVITDSMSKTSGSIMLQVADENFIVAYSRIPRLDLMVVHTSSTGLISKNIFLLRVATVLLLLASIALMFVVITFATKKLVTRLYLVIEGMRKIHEGNLAVSVQVPGNDEVAEMARTFSAMVERIQNLICEIKKEQELVTQTEIKAMQNQINAHFLYNVLETIKMQAEMHDQSEIAQSITLLGRMMRYCLKWRNHRVSLAQELEYIRDYIALMNIRNDYSILLHVSIEEKYLKYQIPKMLIQPVIENAVMHAIEPLGENADLEITASPDPLNGLLLIKVTDYGVGMDSGQIDTLRKQLDLQKETDAPVGGIGLQNIQMRLHAIYGKNYSLKIQSSPGAGTLIIIPVPLEEKQ